MIDFLGQITRAPGPTCTTTRRCKRTRPPGVGVGTCPVHAHQLFRLRAHRAADPDVRSPMTISPDTETTWSTPIDHPLDAHGHGGVTSGKAESQISVAVNNRPVAGAPLPVQYETSCGLLRLTL